MPAEQKWINFSSDEKQWQNYKKIVSKEELPGVFSNTVWYPLNNKECYQKCKI